LSLNSALGYTAALRLSKDQTESERIERVKQVIHEVEMSEHATSMIATYSGGQLKRASLANELLSNPNLLFIDEATSGLDEHSDREIMSMLRGLTDTGKTIVCITHNLGNVPKYVHKLVVMANGGYVAFVGSPTETLQYFSIEDLSDLYVRLKERSGKEWARLFNQIQGAGPKAHTQLATANQIQIEREPSSPLQKLKSLHSQCSVSLRRTVELQKKDKKSLTVAIAQPILVFMLIWVVFGNITDTPKFQYARGLSVIFLLGISAFWFGCSNSAKEIVKERELFERERNAGLSPFGYFFSKVIFLFGLTILQSLFLLITVKFATCLDGSILWYVLPITMTSICGVALGLAISALSANADVASTAVPLAVIPQVILAGMIKPLENLPEYIAWFAAPSYWCFGSMSKIWNEHWSNQVISDGMLSQQEYGLSLFALLIFTLLFFLICVLSLSGKSISFLKSTK
jgi:ABC-type multidrug transport system ATPase subunit